MVPNCCPLRQAYMSRHIMQAYKVAGYAEDLIA